MRVPLILLLLAAGVPVGLSAADAETTGHVYTNADLEKLPTVSVSAPLAPTDAQGRDFVTAFIERERARIDADRQHALDRQFVESETDRERPTGERYWFPGPGYGWGYGFYPAPLQPAPPEEPPLRGEDAYPDRTPPGLDRPDAGPKQHKGRRPRAPAK